MFTFPHNRQFRLEREARELGQITPEHWNPYAMQNIYLQQQWAARQMNNAMMWRYNVHNQNQFQWYNQLQMMYGPNYTGLQAQRAMMDAAQIRARHLDPVVWRGAIMPFGTEGAHPAYPQTPGAWQQAQEGGARLTVRSRAERLRQDAGYQPYVAPRYSTGPGSGPRRRPGPIASPDTPRGRRARRPAFTWMQGENLDSDGNPIPVYETPGTAPTTPQPIGPRGRGRRPQVAPAPAPVAPRTPVARPQEAAKKTAEQAAKLDRSRKEAEMKFQQSQEQATTLEEQIKKLQASRTERERKLSESQKRLVEARDRAAETLAQLRKRTEAHEATVANLDQRITALRERIEKAQKDGDNATALTLTAERATLQEQRQKEMQAAAPLLAELQKTLSSFETLVNELAAQTAEMQREQRDFAQQIEALEKQLRILTGRTTPVSTPPAPLPAPDATTVPPSSPQRPFVGPPAPEPFVGPPAPERLPPATYRRMEATDESRAWVAAQVKSAEAMLKADSTELWRIDNGILAQVNRKWLHSFVDIAAADGSMALRRSAATGPGTVDRYYFDVREPLELRGRWNVLTYSLHDLVLRRDSEGTATDRTDVPPTQMAFGPYGIFGGATLTPPAPSIHFASIRRLMERAVAERRSAETDAADVANFDLPRDRPIGLISLMDDRDRWEGYPRHMGGMLAGRHNIVSQGDHLHFVTGDPIPYLRRQIGAMRNCAAPVRDFLLCMTPHGSDSMLHFTVTTRRAGLFRGGDETSTIDVSPESLMDLFREFPDCRFTLLINSCFGGGFDTPDAFRRGDTAGRVSVFLQIGRTVPNLVRNPDAGLGASYYDTFLARYLAQGLPFGQAHLRARRDLAIVQPGAVPRVWRSGPAGGTMTVENRTPQDELPGGTVGQA